MDLEVGWVRVVDLEGRFGSIVTLLTVRYGRKSLYGDSYLDCFFLERRHCSVGGAFCALLSDLLRYPVLVAT